MAATIDGRNSNALCKCSNYRCVYTVHLSPALNGSSGDIAFLMQWCDRNTQRNNVRFLLGLPQLQHWVSKNCTGRPCKALRTSEDDSILRRAAPGLHEVHSVSAPQRRMTSEYHTGRLVHTTQFTWEERIAVRFD